MKQIKIPDPKYNYYRKRHNKVYKIKLWWLKWFLPSFFISKYSDLPIHLLKHYSIKLLVCDIDNTLVPYYKLLSSPGNKKFYKKLKKNKIELVLVSNNLNKRVKLFADSLGVKEYYSFTRKPFSRILKNLCKNKNLDKKQIAILGDQIFTDILMANIFGCMSILVPPILSYDKSSSWITNLIEHFIYKRLSRNNTMISINKYDDNESGFDVTKQFKWF